jgi:hypothetical protein
MQTRLFLAFTFLAALEVGALPQQPVLQTDPAAESAPPAAAKPAWKWTLEERLAARFDAEQQKKRNAADVAEGYTDWDDEHTVTIVGRTHPEVFLPWELFDQLLRSGLAEDLEVRQAMRSVIEERAVALGFGLELWDQLEQLGARFHQLKQQRLEDARRGVPSPTAGLSAEERLRLASEGPCGVRAEAFAAALKLWGEEKTLRLLYEAVAPDAFVTTLRSANYPEELVFVGRGCQ